jgi:hypothetical protein
MRFLEDSKSEPGFYSWRYTEYEESARRLLQQNLPRTALSRCSKVSPKNCSIRSPPRRAQAATGDRKSKCLAGFEVQEQLNLRGLLYRQVRGLVAFENPAGFSLSQSTTFSQTLTGEA